MDKLQSWLQGKKTYLTAGAILIVGILAEYKIEVPLYIWGALAAAGLGFLRAGVENAKK